MKTKKKKKSVLWHLSKRSDIRMNLWHFIIIHKQVMITVWVWVLVLNLHVYLCWSLAICIRKKFAIDVVVFFFFFFTRMRACKHFALGSEREKNDGHSMLVWFFFHIAKTMQISSMLHSIRSFVKFDDHSKDIDKELSNKMCVFPNFNEKYQNFIWFIHLWLALSMLFH